MSATCCITLAYSRFQAPALKNNGVSGQHINHHIRKREPLDDPPRGGNLRYRFSAFWQSQVVFLFWILLRPVKMSGNSEISQVSESVLPSVADGEMQPEDAQRWGDTPEDDPEMLSQVPPSAQTTPELFTPNETSAENDDNPIPAELRDLVSLSGVRFVRCQDAWNVDGWAAKLRRNLSITFTIDDEITGEDILDGFDHAGFDTDKIVAIQRKVSNRS